jgi:ubiquinone/menaquinone biosynthesis C-methylase UbiE
MSTNYDRIARFYDVDMAQNMPFDDAGFYAEQCAAAAGPVLELGCGNGRILLRLLERGIDAWGVDSSAQMLAELRRKAAERCADQHAQRVKRQQVRGRVGSLAVGAQEHLSEQRARHAEV